MSTLTGLSASFKMLQSRLFSTSNILSRATARIVFPRSGRTRVDAVDAVHVDKFQHIIQCSVFNRCSGPQWVLKSWYASGRCKILNQRLSSKRFHSVLTFQSARALSTSQTVRAIFSKRSDDKPPDTNLVYTGPLSNMVKMVKLFSLSTSGISLMILQMIVLSGETGAMKFLGGSMATLIFLTPIALHWITKSYATQIYFDQTTDTYTSYTVSFFLTAVRQDFKPTDVETPAVRNLMTSVVVKGKPLLIDPRAFVSPNHYSHLMGYDKLAGDFSSEDIKRAMAEFAEEDQHKD